MKAYIFFTSETSIVFENRVGRMNTSARRLLLGVIMLNFVAFLFLVPAFCKKGENCFFAKRHRRKVLLKATMGDIGLHTQQGNNHVIKYSHSGVAQISCPEKSGLLRGELAIDLDEAQNTYWNLTSSVDDAGAVNVTYLGPKVVVAENDTELNPAIFHPSQCRPSYSTAIIIPFRHREDHLKYLLGHLIPVLQRQLLRFAIFVITQSGEDVFNKGRLMNTGFNYAFEAGNSSGFPFDCYIFHDVDLLVEHDTLPYRCTDGNTVNHLCKAIDKYEYQEVCCGVTTGGVMAMKEEQIRMINGYSNSFAGWGGEDDDLNLRLRHKGISIQRPQDTMQGRYTMLMHAKDEGNPLNDERFNLLKDTNKRLALDGLSDLKTATSEIHFYPLFTNLIVDVEGG